MWRSLKAMARLVRVGRLLARHGALDALASQSVAVRLWTKLCGRSTQAGGLAAALTHAGPSYVKFGQFLATRSDMVSPTLRQELAQLHDAMPFFAQAQAEAVIVAAFGQPIDTLFKHFGAPVAAASVAQVHKAQLRNGKWVAVKVLRPHIKERFANDLAGLKLAARWGQRFNKRLRRLNPVLVVSLIEQWVREETDMRQEAAAASEYADTTWRDNGFYVPEVIWTHTSREVLTLEWIDGIALSNDAALACSGLCLKTAAVAVLRWFLTHATRDGLFHGDMHPGNLFLLADGALAPVDFGVMGMLDPATRGFMAQILYGFVTRDYALIARVHFEAGYVPAHHSQTQFARALRAVGEPIFGRSAGEISMGRVLAQLFSVTEAFDMPTRPELVLLQRTMVTAEGVARRLDPTIDIWAAARPVLAQWMRRNVGLEAQVRRLLRWG